MKCLRKIFLTACICVFLALAGCGAGTVNNADMSTDLDIAETAPGSLGLDVVNYHWSYLNDGAHIRVWGRVMNTSGQPFQSVTFHGILYDQKGRVLAQGSSYIAPTYLKPGAAGDFDFTAVAARDSGVSNTHLVSNCQTSAL